MRKARVFIKNIPNYVVYFCPIKPATHYFSSFYVIITLCQGVAQLVARSVRDAEAVGSSPITLTTKTWIIFISGVGAAVARTSGGREVASSILVPPTKQEVERK